MKFDKIWQEQFEFNQMVWGPKPNNEDQVRAFTLGLISELDELMRCTIWSQGSRPHRGDDQKIPKNQETVKMELADIFKYWVSLCLVLGVSPDEAERAFWKKSMVCRQRLSEERLHRIAPEERIALVDIDAVLCDYRKGLLWWIRDESGHQFQERCNRLLKDPTNYWIDSSSLGVDPMSWEQIKDDFRRSGAKAYLPAFGDASLFLKNLESSGYAVVLLTSRPIDRYPNLYEETIRWLATSGFQYRALWWSNDKFERVSWSEFSRNVRIVVDDDLRHLDRFSKNPSIKCYWVQRGAPGELPRNSTITPVKGLEEIPIG